jgi:hypothetical protein
MWQCEKCYNIFHFECIKTWAEPTPSNVIYDVRRLFAWTCPLCSERRAQRPRAACWCGKQSSGTANRRHDRSERSERPNSCSNLCEKVAKCVHDKDTEPCTKRCHPGPCNLPCKASCAEVPETVPETMPGKPSYWVRLCEWYQARRRGVGSLLFLESVLMSLLYYGIGRFTSLHISWWSEPWRHHDFTKYDRLNETMVLISVGCFLVLPLVVLLVGFWAETVYSYVTMLWSLDDTSTRSRLKAWAREVLELLLLLAAVAAVLGPIIA